MEDTTFELDGQRYQRWYDRLYDARGIAVSTTLARRLEQMWQSSQAASHPRERSMKAARPAARPDYHSRYAEVYPIIAALIEELYQEAQTWIGHREIVAALMAHPEGQSLIAGIAAESGNAVEWTASNVMQWFSANYTKGQLAYQDDFEQTEVDGVKAYRPVKRGT